MPSGVVGSNVPRIKAVFHAAIPAAAFLAGEPAAGVILGLAAALMLASVVLGPRFSLFGILATKVVRPALRIGAGRPEDVTPHRFAELVGSLMLGASALAYLAGAAAVGAVIALIVVALAALNAAAGLCLGCQIYLLYQRQRAGATA